MNEEKTLLLKCSCYSHLVQVTIDPLDRKLPLCISIFAPYCTEYHKPRWRERFRMVFDILFRGIRPYRDQVMLTDVEATKLKEFLNGQLSS